ncbi:unnamed protein product [Urochloa humidicola]
MISSINSQDPLPSFRKVRSQLILEETSLQNQEKQLGGGAQALYAGRVPSSPSSSTGAPKKKKKGKPNTTGETLTIPPSTGGTPATGGGGSSFGHPSNPSMAQWQAGFNPWTGMVQA